MLPESVSFDSYTRLPEMLCICLSRTGSYSELYVPDPRDIHILNDELMNEYASSQGLAAFFTGRSLKINSSTSMHVQGDGLLRSVRKLNLKKWGKCMFRGRAASFSQCNLKIELKHKKRTKSVCSGGLAALFSGRNVKPLLIGSSLMLFQQITGQPSVLYYAAKIFKDAGFASDSDATRVSVVLGFFKLVMTGQLLQVSHDRSASGTVEYQSIGRFCHGTVS